MTTDLLKQVSSIFGDALSIDNYDDDADFIEMGATSIETVKLIGVLRTNGFEISARTLFRNPTPRQLCDALSQ